MSISMFWSVSDSLISKPQKCSAAVLFFLCFFSDLFLILLPALFVLIPAKRLSLKIMTHKRAAFGLRYYRDFSHQRIQPFPGSFSIYVKDFCHLVGCDFFPAWPV